MNDKNVRFIRVRGRVVPIKMSKTEMAARGATAGAAVVGGTKAYWHLMNKVDAQQGAMRGFSNTVKYRVMTKQASSNVAKNYYAQQAVKNTMSAKYAAKEFLEHGRKFKTGLGMFGAGLLGMGYFAHKEKNKKLKKTLVRNTAGMAAFGAAMIGINKLSNNTVAKFTSWFTPKASGAASAATSGIKKGLKLLKYAK